MVLSDLNVGILDLFAISSLGVYGTSNLTFVGKRYITTILSIAKFHIVSDTKYNIYCTKCLDPRNIGN
jgi:hypothetical protein